MAPAVAFGGHDCCHLEAGLLRTAGEKQTSAAPRTSTAPGPPATPTRRMSTLRRVVLAFAMCSILGFSLATAASLQLQACPDGDCSALEAAGVEGNSRLSQMWQSASPEGLHELLHKYFPDRYQHGVYETDEEAVEAIQADQPEDAPKLPQLLRRQDDGGNGTMTTSSVPPDTTSGVFFILNMRIPAQFTNKASSFDVCAVHYGGDHYHLSGNDL